MKEKVTGPQEKTFWLSVLVSILAAGIFSMLFTSAFFPFFYSAKPFEFEMLMRFWAGLFFILLFLILAIDTAFLNWLDTERWRGGLILIFFAGLLLTFVFSATTLRTEENPIRDWTAGALLAASLMAFRAVAMKQEAAMKLLGVFLGCVFLFGAADERFEFHENIASTVLYFYDIRHGTVDGLDWNNVQDATTLTYAGAGLLVLTLLLVAGFLFGNKLNKNPSHREAGTVQENTLRSIYLSVGIVLAVLAVVLPVWGLVFTPEFAAQNIALSYEVQPRVLPFIRNFRIGVSVVGLLFIAASAWWWNRKQVLLEFIRELLMFSPQRLFPEIFRTPPLRLFAAAVLLFACAMTLDTWDKAIAAALNPGLNSGVTPQSVLFSGGFRWVFHDPAELANFWEEILEFAAAMCFMGMSGSLFHSSRWRKPLGWSLSPHAKRFKVALFILFVVWLILNYQMEY